MFMSLNSSSIIILVIFFAVFFLSLALIVWMLVSVMRQGDERRRLIISKACTNTFLVMIGYLLLCTIEHICGGAILLQKKVWRIILKNKIRELRKQRGISQEELAKRCGVSRQTINAIENNKYDPTLALAFKLSKELFTTVDELFQTE